MLWGSKFTRFLLVCTLLALLAAWLPAATAQASPELEIALNFEVIAVKGDESVTIRTKDFPMRTKFNVLMDVAGEKGIDGIQAAEFDSGKGGAVEGTFPIPKELHGKIILAIRLESTDGYYAGYNWFFNRTMVVTTPDPNKKPEISFLNVKQNTSLTVAAKNLPAAANFRVRIGPAATFYRDYVHLDPVESAADGTLKFDVQLPKVIQEKNAENMMIRVDGGGMYAYAIYKNVDGGTAVSPGSLYKAVDCKIINLNPIPQQDPNGDFDVVWTIQNTGTREWTNDHVMFVWLGGEKMHKYEDKYPLDYNVKYGKVIEFAIDMTAPEAAGWHTTIWAVKDVVNNQVLCKAPVTMSVK
jgi:hypothetical protein